GAAHAASVRVEVPLAERPVVVRAAVLDRVQLAGEVVDANRYGSRVHELHLAGRQLVQRAHLDDRQATSARARRSRTTPPAAASLCPCAARASASSARGWRT